MIRADLRGRANAELESKSPVPPSRVLGGGQNLESGYQPMSNSRKNILAISGSTRIHSSNEAILNSIASSCKEVLNVQLYTGIADLPHFNPDTDNEQVPLAVKSFRDLIDKADGVIICTPEYVFSLPGALKNAIEWTVSTTVFSDKPTAVIVASGLGEKAYESLLLIMKTVGAKVGEQSSLLIKGARSKVDDKGQLADQSTKKQLDSLMGSFIANL